MNWMRGKSSTSLCGLGLCSAAAFKRKGETPPDLELRAKTTTSEPLDRLQEPLCFHLLATAPQLGQRLDLRQEIGAWWMVPRC